MVRIGTLNVENLFARYNFRKKLDPVKDEGFSVNKLAFDLYKEDEKKITAKLIKLMDADVLALQEVESLSVLDRFNSKYLRAMGYKYRMVVDAFDPRKIDVAVLSRYPITHIRSYRDERTENKRAWVFSRDCLEVDVDIEGKSLRLFVNHFKSMIGGRQRTRPKRERQANKVAEIIDELEGDFVVLGDFNDYPGRWTGLNALLKHPKLEDVIDRLDHKDTWTHYWSGGDEYKQLDYILVSESLSKKNAEVLPEIFRQGLPYRAEKYSGSRIKGVGKNHPKASDHAGIVLEI